MITNMADDPVLARMILGRLMRQYRERAGLTRGELSKYMSNTKLYNLERGVLPSVRAQDVIALGFEYGVSRPESKHLIALADKTTESGWTESLDVPLHFQAYIGMESECTCMWIYESEFINGLFQTPEYFGALQQHFTKDDPDKGQAVRLKRQDTYFGEPVADTQLILNEAALKRKIGGRKVLKDQVARLVELSELPTVSVSVLPFEVGGHPSMGSSYIVMGFAETSFPSVVYLEAPDGTRYEERAATVSLYERLFQDTLKLAKPIKDLTK